MRKSLAERWKEHYASFLPREIEAEIEEEESPENEIELLAEVVESPKKVATKREIKKLLAVRELLRKQAEIQEERRRALDIKEIDQADYVINPTSIESYLLRVLSPIEEGLHINLIIEQMEALGWSSNSKYHKYAQVYSAIRSNYFMFVRTGKATFKLREGFRGRKPEIVAQPATTKENDGKLTTLKDISYDISLKYQDDDGIYPAKVHFIMKHMGYNCNYSSVYRAMQCNLFTRNGFWYKPNDLRITAKENKG